MKTFLNYVKANHFVIKHNVDISEMFDAELVNLVLRYISNDKFLIKMFVQIIFECNIDPMIQINDNTTIFYYMYDYIVDGMNYNFDINQYIKQSVNNGLKLNEICYENMTYFNMICIHENLESSTILYCINEGNADIFMKNPEYDNTDTNFMVMCRMKYMNIDIMKACIDLGYKHEQSNILNICNEDNTTPLYWICHLHSLYPTMQTVELIKYYLQNGADINSSNEYDSNACVLLLDDTNYIAYDFNCELIHWMKQNNIYINPIIDDNLRLTRVLLSNNFKLMKVLLEHNGEFIKYVSKDKQFELFNGTPSDVELITEMVKKAYETSSDALNYIHEDLHVLLSKVCRTKVALHDQDD
jgi:hypothetical protein